MLVRIIHKTVRRSGRASQREELLDVEQLAIGRGTENDLQLNGLTIELRHSRLEKRSDGVYLVPVEGQVLVNGRKSSERRLRVKDSIQVGPFEIVVAQAAPREDLCLELSQAGVKLSEREDLERRTRIGLSRGLFTPRKLSWGSVIFLPLLFIGVPIATGGLETSWDSGPVARVHAFIAEDCQKCHAVAFERVRDQECLQCHGGIKAHTPPDMEVARLDQTRCAECHIEHGGTYGLAALEQELCSDCHSKLGDHAPKTKVRTVTDFKDEHPEFRLSVPTENFLRRPLSVDEQPRGDSFDWVRGVDRIEISDELREHSGVRFNHVRHVAQEEKKDGSGRLLNCGDCHQMDAAGKNMLAINFEDHCQSCHSIGFDPRYEREAIHGDPVRMREDLRVFYEAQELEDLEQRIRKGQVMRARVGSQEEVEQRAAARKNAEGRVQRADAFLMDEQKPGACANCHDVKRGKASDGGYDVEPVRLLDVWMPKSLFTHETHDPFPCRDCHPAAAVYDAELAAELEGEQASPGRAGIRRAPGTQVRRRPDWSLPGIGRPYVLYTPEELMRERQLKPSEEAVDILIPSIEKCQGCHAGAYASQPKVASECVLCHPFHREEFNRMRKIDAQQTTTSGPEIDSSNGAG